MTEDNVMEFCQWLVSEKGIEAGNLSDYINNNEEEVLKLAQEFKKPKFKVGGKIEAAAEMFKCGGKTKKKIKKHANGDPITIPVKLDESRTGYVTYNPDGTRKETIKRVTETWKGTSFPNEAVTHRVVTPDSTAMYVQYGLADEEMGRGYLYNTARKMGAREKANQAKFDPRFDELNRRANFRLAVLPDGKMVIRDVVHTDDDTLTRVIDQNDTTIVNSAGDRFNNNSFRTRLARKIFGSSAYDQANKNFEMIDFQKTGGIVKAQEGNKMTVDDIHNINKSMYNHMSYSNPKGFWEFTKSDYGDRYHHQNIMDGKKVGFHTFVYDEPNPILNSFYWDGLKPVDKYYEGPFAEDTLEDYKKAIKQIAFIEKYGNEMLLPENKAKIKITKEK